MYKIDGPLSYPITIGHALEMPFSNSLIITDGHVAQLYGHSFRRNLISVGVGEAIKTREKKAWLEDQLLQSNCQRDTCLVAFGGGTVSDLVGFVASTYYRGIDFVNIPTTLLAMVDAAIGGKNGLNVGSYKNVIGTIYQPKAVFIDSDYLRTLPPRELYEGFSEMVKYGIISNLPFLEFLERKEAALKALDRVTIEEAIYLSCLAKVKTITEDLHDKTIRQTLNYGHTIGHMLEGLSHYTISHGEAVNIGMAVEGFISQQQTHFKELPTLLSILAKYRYQKVKLPPYTHKEALDLLHKDKKKRGDEVHFVLLTRLGQVADAFGYYTHPVPQKRIEEALEWMDGYLLRN